MTVFTTNTRDTPAVRWRMTLTRGYGLGPGGEPAGCGGPYPGGWCRRNGGRDDMAALDGAPTGRGLSAGRSVGDARTDRHSSLCDTPRSKAIAGQTSSPAHTPGRVVAGIAKGERRAGSPAAGPGFGPSDGV